MIDYNERAERLQKTIARLYTEKPIILNVPGRSMACKVDLHYYLAVHPGFINTLAQATPMLPTNAGATLVHTGDVVTNAVHRDPVLKLRIAWLEGGRRLQQATVEAVLLNAAFIDRALLLYAGVQTPPISALRIDPKEKARLDAFLHQKTLLQKDVFKL